MDIIINDFNNNFEINNPKSIIDKMINYINNYPYIFNINDFFKKSLGHLTIAVLLIKLKIQGKNVYKGPLINKYIFNKIIDYSNDEHIYVRNIFQSLLYELTSFNKLDSEEIHYLKLYIINNNSDNLWRFNMMMLKPTILRESFFGSFFGQLVGSALGIVIDGDSTNRCIQFAESYVKDGKNIPKDWILYKFGQVNDECEVTYSNFENIIKVKGVLTNYDDFIQCGLIFSKQTMDYILYVLDYKFKNNSIIQCFAIALKIVISTKSLPLWYDIFLDILASICSPDLTNNLLEIKKFINMPFNIVKDLINNIVIHHQQIVTVLYSFCKFPDSFEYSMATAISLSGLNLSVTCELIGALVGSRVGVSNIPTQWIHSVHNTLKWNFDDACSLAENVFDLVQSNKVRLSL
jgi:hypothetical protein